MGKTNTKAISWSARRLVSVFTAITLSSLVVYYYSFDQASKFNSEQVLSEVATDPEFIKYFGESLQGVTKIDTDSDGIPDVKDADIDNDGTPNFTDNDVDNDGTPNASDPSSAVVALAAGTGLTSPSNAQTPPAAPGEKGDKGDKGDTGDSGTTGNAGDDGSNGSSGQNGANGSTGLNGNTGNNGGNGDTGNDGNTGNSGNDGSNGNQGLKGDKGDTGATGAKGDKGDTGTIGAVTNDGVIKTTLTGASLDLQILLATGSGLQKTTSGLSLTTTCATNELLKWNGSAWACGTDDGGINYTAGTGITVSAGVINSVLGVSIDSSEITDGTIQAIDLANSSVTTNKLVDGSVITSKIVDGSVVTAKLGDSSVSTSKLIDSAVTFAKIQALSGGSLFGNPTGSAATGSEVALGNGLNFNGSALENSGILSISVNGPIDSTGGQNPTLSIVQATGLVDGYISAADFASFAAKQNALPAGLSTEFIRGDQTLGTLDTDAVAEGSNLFFTNSRADSRITIQKGFANGLATLDGSGKVPSSQLPALAITNTYVVADEAAMLALTANQGDVAVRTDENKTYILSATPASTLGNWLELLTPGAPVQSVNGMTGSVTLTTSDIAEGVNLYYTDARARSAVSGSGVVSYNSSTGVFGLSQAGSSTSGYLSSTDFNTFNNKQSALPTGTASQFLKGDLTLGTLNTDNVPEGSTNQYYTALRFNNGFAAKNTDNLIEGLTNKYYTDGRADARINAQKGAVNGVASLDGTGKVPTSQLPAMLVNSTYVVADQAAMLALSANQGDVAVRSDVSETYVLSATPASTLSNWVKLLTPTAPVLSVNGQTGAVSLITTDVTEGTNLYFTDSRARGSISANGPLTYNSSTGVLGLSLASGSTNGYLSSTDWTTFNAKQATITASSGLTFSGNNLSLTNQGITFSLGTSGTDVNLSSTTVNLGGSTTLNIPDASATARGLVTTGAQTLAGSKTFSGSLATSKGSDFSTTGTVNDANFGNTSLVRLTGASAQTITGIAGGADGKILTIINAGAATSSITNNDALSLASNRITTGTSSSIALPVDASISLIYDSTSTKWRVVGGTGSSSAGYASIDITNKATGGAIGAAAATVDIATNFNVNQTTALQALTIPSPTNTTTTKGKIVTVNNLGTANFSISGITVPAGSYGSAFVWNGTAWNPINAASNVAGATFSASKSSSSTSSLTTIAGNTTTLQPTTARLPLTGAGIDTSSNNVTVATNNITILQTGKYRITGNWNSGNSSSQNFLGHQYVKNNTTILPGGVFALNDTTIQGGPSYSSSVDVDLVTGDTLDMRVFGNSGTTTNYLGYSFSASLISGNAPVIGQSVNYINARSTTSQNAASGTMSFIAGDVKASQGFTLSGNTFVAATSGQYRVRMEANATSTTGTFESINVSVLKNGSVVYTTPTTPIAEIDGFGAFGVPYSVDTIISLNAGDNVSFNWGGNGGSKGINLKDVNIQQLGSTAFTSVAMSALSAALANNSLDNTNYTQTWDFSTLTTTNGLVSNANALTSGILKQLATSSTAFTGSLLNLSSTGNNAGVTGSLASINIVGGTSAAKGLTLTNAGTGDGIYVASTGTGLGANIGGGVAFRAGSTYTTPGSTNDVALGNASFVRLDTSAAAQTLTGIAGGADGKLLTLTNADAALAVTLSNQSVSSVAANRIVTGTGSDINIAAGASVSLIYDATDSRWRVVGGTGGGSSASSTTIATNFPTGGSIGTAAATVDANSSIIISGQTTAGQSLSLPNPTNTAAGKIVTVTNTSTASFTMYTTQLSASSPSGSFIWTGSAWNPIGTSINVATENGSAAPGASTTALTATKSTLATVNIPSAGSWLVNYTLVTSAANTTANVQSGLFDSTGTTLQPNSSVSFEPNAGGTSFSNSGMGSQSFILTTTGPTTYLWQANSNGSGVNVVNSNVLGNGSGVSQITWQKISGNSAVTGQSVDYVFAKNTTTQALTTAANQPIAFNNTVSGNIPLASNTFTLTAGKTYRLEGNVGGASGSSAINYQWRDTTNNTFIGSVATHVNVSSSFSNTSNISNAVAVITPTTNVTVQLWAVSVSGAVNIGTGVNVDSPTDFPWAQISQLGSTASTGVAMSSLTAAIANNALDNTNYTQTWDFSTLTTTNGLVSNANALTSGVLKQLATSSTAFTGSLLNLSSTGNNAGVTGSLASINIVGGTSAAKGLTLTNAGTGDGINVASTGTGLALNIQGAIANKKGTDFSTVGVTVDWNPGNTSLVRLTGATAQTIDSITGGVDGKVLTIVNAGANAATIRDASTATTATPANRIKTGTAANSTLAVDASITMTYDSGSSVWRVIGGTGSSTGSYASVDVTDKATGGAIGAAAATVDVATNFNVNQTTASQALTIPSPTNTTTTKGKVITLNNVGTANFTLGGITVPAGSYGSAFVWTGTVWNPINAASNVAAENGQVSGITTGQTTTSTSFIDVTGSSFTLPSAGTYEVTYSVSTWNAGVNGAANYFQITDNSGTVVPNSYGEVQQAGTTNNSTLHLTHTVQITTTGATTYKLQWKVSAGTGTISNVTGIDGNSTITWNKISGNTPVAGQSVDYVNAVLSADTTPVAGSNVVLTTDSGNIPNASGVFTLRAGKTYELSAYLASDNTGSAGQMEFQWRNLTANAYIGKLARSFSAANTTNFHSAEYSARAVITPNTDITVALRTISVSGGSPLYKQDSSSVMITQLGSSSVTSLDIAGEIGTASSYAASGTGLTTTPGGTTVATLTLPSAGTWEIDGNLRFVTTGSSNIVTAYLYNGAGALVPNTEILPAFTNTAGAIQSTVTPSWRITTTGPETYTVRAHYSNTGTPTFQNDSGGRSVINFRKISGFTPSIGQSAEAATFKLASSWTNGANTYVNSWQTTPDTGSTTISSTGTNFVIPAGKAFTLDLSLMSQTGVHSSFSVRDVTGGTPGTQLGAALVIGLSNAGNFSSSSAQTVFIPASGAARTVSVRLDSINSSNPTLGSSQASITFTQVGTTAFTGITMSSLAAALANNTLDNTNFAQTWNWSTLAAGTSGLTFGNTVGGTTQNNVITILGGNNTGVAASQLVTFKRTDGTVIGSVSQNAASTVAFNTTSDERLKQGITDSEIGLDRLLKIKVRDYSYKSDPTGKVLQGFVAQELNEVYGEAVTVGSNQVDENGLLTNPWQVDYGKLTPLLVKGIQDLDMKVENGYVSVDGQQIDGLSQLGGKVSKLTEGLNLVQGNISDLTSALDTINQRLTGIDTRLTALEGKEPTVIDKTVTVQNTPQSITNVTQQIMENTSQYGSATILKNKLGVKVVFEKAYAAVPAVFVTPLSGESYQIKDATTTGFTILLSKAAESDASFNWMAAERKAGAAQNTTQIDAPAAPATVTTPPANNPGSTPSASTVDTTQTGSTPPTSGQ